MDEYVLSGIELANKEKSNIFYYGFKRSFDIVFSILMVYVYY